MFVQSRIGTGRLWLGVALLCAATAVAEDNRAEILARRGLDGVLFAPAATQRSRVLSPVSALGLGGSPSVAIVASAAADVSAGQFTDPRDKLQATGQFSAVDIFHAGLETPSLLDLLAYDSVLVWSNLDFEDATSLGDVLADYVDAGRGVALSTYATTSVVPDRSLGGRWATDGYGVITPNQGEVTGQSLLGVVSDPLHTVMSGVVALDGGLLSARPASISLESGATLLADWDDGMPLAAVRDDLAGGRVDLGLYPPSDDVVFFYWDASTDGARLLANALIYTSGLMPIDVAVQVVVLSAPSATETTDDPSVLPGQISSCTSAFVIELWVSDLGAVNTGITGLYVDVLYDQAVLQVDNLVNGSLFPSFTEGTIDNAQGQVTNFGGSNFQTPQGISPTWAKLGHLEVSQVADGQSRIGTLLGVGGLGVFGRVPPPLSEIDFGISQVTCDSSCVDVVDCCDGDSNGVIDSSCLWCACDDAGACDIRDTPFADMGGPFGECDPDGFCNTFDANLALSCFAELTTCDKFNIDTGGPFGSCAPDGFCNLFDANHALACFAKASSCTCSPSPEFGVPPVVVGKSGISTEASRSGIAAGEEVRVLFFVDDPAGLQSYELHVEVSGGRSGRLEFTDVTIESRRDFVFADQDDRFDAFNLAEGKMLAGLYTGSVQAQAKSYLATFAFRASDDALGAFVVSLRHGDEPGTSVLVSDLTKKIEISRVSSAVVEVR